MLKNVRLSTPILAILLAFVPPGCGGAASYTRFRRAAEEGRMVAAAEVRPADFIDYHATEDAPRPPVGAGGEAPIYLDARPGTPTIGTGSGHVPLMVSLRGGVGSFRMPSEIVVLVDVSGSMQEGDKIGAVRHALARFVERLDPHDHLAILAFADGAHVALPPSEVWSARSSVLAAIEGLAAYGGTNLYEGLASAIEQASLMGADGAARRVIVLSDGVPSVGVMEREPFVALARTAHARRVSITTVGMGGAIDFALLDAIAANAGGDFHYLDRPSEVERLFSTEIVSLLTLAARDVRIRVTLPAGWSVFQSYAERTETVGSVVETRVGDLAGDDADVFLVELAAAPGTAPVQLPVEVTLTAPDGTSSVVARTDVVLARSGTMPDTIATDPMVLRNLALGRCAVAVRIAATLSESGDVAGARATLDAAVQGMLEASVALTAMGETDRARSLDEPTALLLSSIAGLPAVAAAPAAAQASTSSRFLGWR